MTTIPEARAHVQSFLKVYRDRYSRDLHLTVVSEDGHRFSLDGADLLRLVDGCAPFRISDPVAPARASDPVTSHVAARRVDAVNSRGRVLLAFVRARTLNRFGGRLTTDTAIVMAGLTSQRSPWKRVSELKAAGWIETVGVVNGSAGSPVESYRLTDAGMAEAVRVMPDEVAALRGTIGVRR